jgi:DNA (cytosine-5)-methyltransferase 1
VTPFLLAINHGGEDDRSHGVGEPLATLTAKTGHSVVFPFLTKYYGTGICQTVDAPLDTITTRDRFGLASAWLGNAGPVQPTSEAMASLIATCRQLGVADIGFRMLEPAELAAAQGFPSGYTLLGNKEDQVRQVGNSVSPPVARAICQTIAEAA